jgi:hypothetical protein
MERKIHLEGARLDGSVRDAGHKRGLSIGNQNLIPGGVSTDAHGSLGHRRVAR